MRTSESIAKLATALSAAQGEMKNAPLNRTNPHYRSKYADLPSVRDAVQGALSKHALAVAQYTDFDGDRFVLRTRIMHGESGEWIEGVYPLPMAADKPQAIGSAISYARRYTLAAICGIAADEDDDANAAHEAPPQRQQARQQPKQQTEGTPFDGEPGDTARKMADQLRAAISATTSSEELQGVYKRETFTRTFNDLPEDLQIEVRRIFHEHQQFVRGREAEGKAA